MTNWLKICIILPKAVAYRFFVGLTPFLLNDNFSFDF